MAKPKEAPITLTSPVPITINSDYTVTPANVTISFNQNIQFTNNAAQTCSIFFNPGDEFGAQTQYIGPGQDLALSPTEDNVTVCYVINGGAAVYSITVIGCAPVEMDVDSAGNCSIGNAAMPHRGWIRFTYNQTGIAPPAYITVNFVYPVRTAADFFNRVGTSVFSQQLNPGDNTPLIADGSNNVLVQYNFTGTTEGGDVGGGNGTIKIGH